MLKLLSVACIEFEAQIVKSGRTKALFHVPALLRRRHLSGLKSNFGSLVEMIQFSSAF